MSKLLAILIVEDNEAQRRVLTDLLREEDFEPVGCATAHEALDVAKRQAFPIAIIDYRLPEMSGIELLAQLRAQQPGLRAIINTGFGSFESAKEAVNLGAFAYVEKLSDPEELLRHVHRAAQDWMAEQLQAAQASYQHLIESVQAVVWRSEAASLQNTFVSQEAEALFGYPVDRWLTEKRFWEQIIHPDDRTRIVALCEEATRNKRSHVLEYRVMAADGREVWVRDIINVLTEHGRPKELVGVMIDITERKEVEEALRRSETHLRTILESEPECVKVIAPDGMLREMNNAGLRMLEADNLAQVRGTSIFEYILPSYREAFKALHEAVLHGGSGLIAFQLQGLHGGQRWVETHAAPLRGPDGTVEAHLAVTRDVTERKQAELDLRYSEAKNKALIQAIPDALFRFSREGVFTDFIPPKMFQASLQPETYLGKRIEEVMAQDVARISRHFLQETLATGEVQEFEYEMQVGEERHFYEARLVPTEQDDVLAMVRDITDRRQAEEALQESEARNEQILQTTLEGYILVDTQGVILDVNPAYCGLTGYTCEELTSMNLHDLEALLSPEEVDERIQAFVAEGSSLFETRHRRKDGTHIDLEVSVSSMIGHDGIYIAAFMRDITERKRAQRALQERERFQEALLRNAFEGICIYDEAGVIRYVSPAVQGILGYEPEELIGRLMTEHIYPNDVEAARETIREVLKQPGIPHRTRRRIVHRDGTTRYVDARTVNLLGDPVVGNILVTFHDVTEQHYAEQALRESEHRYRTLVEHAPDAIVVFDLEANTMVDCNREAERLYGLPRTALLQTNPIAMSPERQPDGRLSAEAGREELQRAAAGEVRVFEWVHRNADDRDVPCEVRLVRLPSATRKLVRGSVTDITERKVAESQIRYQATLLRNVSDAIVATDVDRKIQNWNAAAEQLYGWSAEEVIGRLFKDVVPTRIPGMEVEEAIEALVQNGAWNGEVIQQRRDGTEIHVLSSVTMLTDQEGTYVGIIAANRDITERKRLQRELLEISNREQRRIGQDLHDELGQLLTGIGFRVEELKGDLQGEAPALACDTTEISMLVETAIAQTRALARGLNPVNVEQQGLTAALRELVASIERIYGISCSLMALSPIRIGNLDVATHVYRIAQEALNNAVKHAKASHIAVRLERDRDDGMLTIRDDGRGLPPTFEEQDGMGLRIMDYRARIIGGVFDVRSEPQRGTTISCRFPLLSKHQPAGF